MHNEGSGLFVLEKYVPTTIRPRNIRPRKIRTI